MPALNEGNSKKKEKGKKDQTRSSWQREVFKLEGVSEIKEREVVNKRKRGVSSITIIVSRLFILIFVPFSLGFYWVISDAVAPVRLGLTTEVPPEAPHSLASPALPL